MSAQPQPSKALKPDVINVGDFIYCRSRRYRDQLQLPDELALVIEIKRSNFKVLFANDKRSWIPREHIVRVKSQEGDPPFLRKLHYILKRVHAHECELVSSEGLHRLSIRIDKIDDVAVDDLRKTLAGGFISLAVVPEGMAFMQVELTFRMELSPKNPE